MRASKHFAIAALTAACLWAWGAGAAVDPAKAPEPAAVEKEAAKAQPVDPSRRLVRDGIIVDFEAVPVEGKALMEGMLTEVRFTFTDERTGKPVPGVRAGAWMDVGVSVMGNVAGADQRSCKEKIGLYLKGAVGIRPLVDLNGYYLLVMNKDSTITVIDPMVSLAGRTSTLSVIQLARQPMDWVNYDDTKRLFVTMPSIGRVAVVDTETFKVVSEVDVGKEPARIAAQPDGKYLWIGNNAKEDKDSGVTVLDPLKPKVVMQARTGRGHHEIAFTPDSRLAFVTNRDDGTVSVFDVAALKKLKDIKTGAMPLSVAVSKLSGAAYVSNGRDGTITVIDTAKLEPVKQITAKPGIGPLRFTPDGRFGMAVNTGESVVHVIDPGSNEIIHNPKVEAEPYQVIFSREFAYVRGLGSERVNMINLSSLGKDKQPIVQTFAAGSYAPKLGGDLPLADSMTAALGEAAAFVVSPAENATYFYMEGMNAPMFSYQGRGHLARAATVIDRSLKETEPGVFTGRLRLPISGKYDVALSVDQPPMVHCFSTTAKANPALEQERKRVAVQFMPQGRHYQVSEKPTLRFRVLDGEGTPRPGLKDVVVRYYMAPASSPSQALAKEVGDGVYEAPLEFGRPGAYYIHVGARSVGLGFNDSGYFSVLVKPDGEGPASAGQPGSGIPAAPPAQKSEKQG